MIRRVKRGDEEREKCHRFRWGKNNHKKQLSRSRPYSERPADSVQLRSVHHLLFTLCCCSTDETNGDDEFILSRDNFLSTIFFLYSSSSSSSSSLTHALRNRAGVNRAGNT